MSAPAPTLLAFSGGLDTSFCVPWLAERGHRVISLYVDTGGTGRKARDAIATRAGELGVAEHLEVDAGQQLWERFVRPFVMGGQKYQGQYPLLCSDRYIIAECLVRTAGELGAQALAHGCTAMGNDQFRFDQALRSLCDMQVVAPVRELQGQVQTGSLRDHEITWLAERGHAVAADAKRYTINENLLGTTISGSEIDLWQPPHEGTHRLCRPRPEWPQQPLRMRLRFERGALVAIDGREQPGPAMLALLNKRFGAYGVGRGLYTGNTIVGLKGRILFEGPGLEALLVAHRALEELVLTPEQHDFKRCAGQKWTQLVFGGLFYDPLRADLEALLASSQQSVTGEVVVETCGGNCQALAVDTPNALTADDAVYAQSAAWSAAEAAGFVRIHGNASAMGARARGEGEGS